MLKKLVYIMADSRSGSTLLERMLNRHPSITSVGELRRLNECIKNDGNCSCGEKISKCKFWEKVFTDFEESLFQIQTLWERSQQLKPITNILLILLQKKIKYFKVIGDIEKGIRISNCCYKIYERISEINDTPIVVDSSKVAYQGRLMYNSNPEKTYFLCLSRNINGLIYSKMRRKNMSVEDAARSTYKNCKMMQLMKKNVRSEHILPCRYEDLCHDPNDFLNKICQFMAISDITTWNRSEDINAHMIGGSPGFDEVNLAGIREDTSWKKVLTDRDIKFINSILKNEKC